MVMNDRWDPQQEIKCHTEQGIQAFIKFKRLLCNRNLSSNLRYRMVKCFEWSILLYGMETWTLKISFIDKLETLQRMFLRPWTDRVKNEDVLRRANTEIKLLNLIKVAWMHFEQSAILTVHNHVITRNPRISVTHDKHRTWFLHINNVQEEDKGRYMCQINTVTAKTQFGFLHVVVPPNIDDSLSSSDAIVREGSNETLTCKATGFPTPSVKWKRDDNTKITINKTLQVSEWEGETLELTKISRLDMGAYLCIASNGVPPTVSKRIKVSVDFSSEPKYMKMSTPSSSRSSIYACRCRVA
uniref:Neuronal growth regulator 1-like n=1 Tax=Diabrotica virgifera virgifera TaxID=50390 RepID=A0A6P7GUD6_DIAVI